MIISFPEPPPYKVQARCVFLAQTLSNQKKIFRSRQPSRGYSVPRSPRERTLSHRKCRYIRVQTRECVHDGRGSITFPIQSLWNGCGHSPPWERGTLGFRPPHLLVTILEAKMAPKNSIRLRAAGEQRTGTGRATMYIYAERQ